MSELTPEAKRFLDEHLPDGTPTSSQKLRGRLAVLAALAAPTAAAAVSKGAAASGAGASGAGAASTGAVVAGASVGVKVVVAVVACAAVVGGAVAVPALKKTAVPPAPVVTVPVVTPAVAPPEPVAEEQEPEATRPPPAKPPRPHHRAAPQPAPVVEPASEPSPPAEDTLAAELQMLSAAQTSMLDGHPARALQVLDEYEHRFGENGRMLEEVRGARVGVLCKLGRPDEARSEYGRLTPGSPFFVRLRAKCW